MVVTSPEPPPLREARFFLERLEQEGLHAAGLVVNRIRPEVPRDPSDAALARAAEAQPDDDRGPRGRRGPVPARRRARPRRHASAATWTAARYGLRVDPVVHVPLLGDDVHDLDGLSAIATTLTTGSTR